jgi:hypothetical protein
MQSDVFSNITNTPVIFSYPKLTKEEEDRILSEIFEQLLIFDRITISAGRNNFALFFLVRKLGVDVVERLVRGGYIRFMLWSPIIVTSTGMQREDKSIDESAIYGKTPIVAGSLAEADLDPEYNVRQALKYFNIEPRRSRQFIKKITEEFVTLEGLEFSSKSADLVIDAYKHNNLNELGLPYLKEPEQLNIQERGLLLELGTKVIETAVLSKFGLKSYDRFEHLKICQNNLQNIGKGYNIAGNTSQLLRLENLPNLKELYLTGKLDFESVFKIRHLGNAKYYRKWINEIGENADASEITEEYLNEIKGKHKFFEKPKGKLIKNLTMFSVNTALGAAIAGPVGATAGLALGLLETFWLDSLLKGKNPSMFVEDLKKEMNNK